MKLVTFLSPQAIFKLKTINVIIKSHIVIKINTNADAQM